MTSPPDSVANYGIAEISHDLMTYHRKNGFNPAIWSLHPDDWNSLLRELKGLSLLIVAYDYQNLAGFKFRETVIVRAEVPPYNPVPLGMF